MANPATTLSKRRATLSFVGLSVFFFFIGGARLRGGIFRIPPDPGFDILRQARPVSRFSFFDISGSYLSITPRIISKIAAFFPVEFSAIIATVSTLTIWSITASICTMLVYKHTSSLFTAIICGFFCMYESGCWGIKYRELWKRNLAAVCRCCTDLQLGRVDSQTHNCDICILHRPRPVASVGDYRAHSFAEHIYRFFAHRSSKHQSCDLVCHWFIRCTSHGVSRYR